MENTEQFAVPRRMSDAFYRSLSGFFMFAGSCGLGLKLMAMMSKGEMPWYVSLFKAYEPVWLGLMLLVGVLLVAFGDNRKTTEYLM